jgi:transposase-like protein
MIGTLGKLPRAQRKVVVNELTAMESRASSIDVIEAETPARPDCPHCASRQTIKHGRYGDLQRFRCRHCNRTFNALSGTPLAYLHLRDKWLGQAEALRDGLTLRQVSERLQVAQSTAFRWRHRFLALPQTVQARALIGIAEADEAYFLRSFKGQRRGIGRVSRKRGGKAAKRGLSAEQVPVLIARDRVGSTANFVLESGNAQEISKTLRPILPADTVLCTDGGTALAAAARDLEIEHHPSISLRASAYRALGTCRTSMPSLRACARGWSDSRVLPRNTSPTTSDGSEYSTGRRASAPIPHNCSLWRSGYEFNNIIR